MKKIISILLTALIIFITFSIPQEVQAATALEQARTLVEEVYVGEINGNINDATTISELMNMLDSYSTHYTYDEFIKMTNTIEQLSVGIGVVIEQVEEGILIVQVVENGSAFEANIKAGSVITHVNGTPIKGLTTDAASNLILGEADTKVTISLLLENGQSITKTLTRKSFSVPIITSKYLFGNIGYIHVSSFSENAAYEMKAAAENLQKQGAKSFIVDLQNNTGGYVSTAQQMISLFPNTVNAYTEITNSKTGLVKPSNLNYKLPGTSRLLINRYSASASEMVAASLLDQKAAILYGETSYGKGVMQSFYELMDDSILKITMAEFTGPNNTKINEVGIKPTIATKEDPISQAHLDAIIEQYPSYKKLNEFTNVATTKTFDVTFSHSIDAELFKDSIQLVQLGGTAVSTSTSINGAVLTVTPSEPLVKGSHYALFIHPDNLVSTSKKKLRTGYYMPVSVIK